MADTVTAGSIVGNGTTRPLSEDVDIKSADSITLKNRSTSTTVITVGHLADLSTGDGFQLAPGAEITLPVTNPRKIRWHAAATATLEWITVGS